MHPTWGWVVAIYLFLGGLAAGAFLVAAVLGPHALPGGQIHRHEVASVRPREKGYFVKTDRGVSLRARGAFPNDLSCVDV